MSRPALPPFVGLVVGKLMRAHRGIQAEGRHIVSRQWLDLLVSLELLEKDLQKGKPPTWRLSEQGQQIVKTLEEEKVRQVQATKQKSA